MTGLDCLREELRKRGMSKVQIESKVVAVVLDILANTGTVHADLRDAEIELNEVQDQLRRAKDRLSYYEERLRNNHNTLEREWDEKEAYICKFNEELQHCETPDGRDAMRRAQMFVNSVIVDSKYDNTAFIIGLAAILSNGEIGAIEELKKINPKLSTPRPGTIKPEKRRSLW